MSTKTPQVTIGETATVEETVTESDIEQFATLSGDHNPLHLDDEYAENTMFDGRIAHGTLVEGFISASLAAFSGVVVFLDKHVSFTDPVKPGDTVTATATITDEIDDNMFEVDVEATVDGTPVIDGTVTILILPEYSS